MGLIKRTSTDHESILSLDIGSEYVKAVLAKENAGELTILGFGKSHQSHGSMHAGAIADIAAVTTACEKALADAEEKAKLTAKLTVVGLSSEAIKSRISTVRYQRDDGTKPLSDQELSLIIQKIETTARDEAASLLAYETDHDPEVLLINSAIVSLTIDGHPVNNPIGFQGSEVILQVYTAFAPRVYVSAIEKICTELNLNLLGVVAEPFALSRAYLGDQPDTSDCIICDIGHRSTKLAIITGNNLLGTQDFSIGGRSFTHQIAKALEISLPAAERLKQTYNQTKLNETGKAKLLTGINRSLKVWLSGLEIALEDCATDTLPSKILICGGGAKLAPLQEKLATDDWYLNLPFARRPLIHLLDTQHLPGFTSNFDLDGSFVTAFGLLRAGSDLLDNPLTKDTLRAKLAKLMQI